MKHSDSIAKLAAALVAVQSALKAVPKDSKNPDFGSKYASLDATIDLTRPVLAEHGLAVVQGATTPHSNETGEVTAFSVETMLVHASGEWLLNAVVVPLRGRRIKGGGFGAADAQSAGSAITYGRRYGLAALLSLSTEEDDDAQVASAPRSAPRAAKPEPEKPTEAQIERLLDLADTEEKQESLRKRLAAGATRTQADEWIAKLTPKEEAASVS